MTSEVTRCVVVRGSNTSLVDALRPSALTARSSSTRSSAASCDVTITTRRSRMDADADDAAEPATEDPDDADSARVAPPRARACSCCWGGSAGAGVPPPRALPPAVACDSGTVAAAADGCGGCELPVESISSATSVTSSGARPAARLEAGAGSCWGVAAAAAAAVGLVPLPRPRTGSVGGGANGGDELGASSGVCATTAADCGAPAPHTAEGPEVLRRPATTTSSSSSAAPPSSTASRLPPARAPPCGGAAADAARSRADVTAASVPCVGSGAELVPVAAGDASGRAAAMGAPSPAPPSCCWLGGRTYPRLCSACTLGPDAAAALSRRLRKRTTPGPAAASSGGAPPDATAAAPPAADPPDAEEEDDAVRPSTPPPT